METSQAYHQRRAREQRALASATPHEQHRTLHEALASLHDRAAVTGGHQPEFAR